MMRLKYILLIKYLLLLTPIILLNSCYTVPLEIRKDNPIEQLAYKYSIRLDSTWTTDRAEALLKIFESISPKPDINVTTSTWKISNDEIQDDIYIGSQDGIKSITISSDVFPIGDVKGIASPYKRLFHAVTQFITENGTNRSALKTILIERYGILVDVQYYDVLTQNTTKETKAHYTEFENEDLMLLISILEDFPQELHKVPQLKYIICRLDDDIRAAGVAWTTNEYIELVESMFRRDYISDTRRVIAHEKAHFLWTHLFPQQLKNDWQELGGWYKNPKSEEGWSTDKDRKGFVSDYAHEKNPNEDMAESLAFYLVDPDRLRDCCMQKYNFIHNRIMLTYRERYISANQI